MNPNATVNAGSHHEFDVLYFDRSSVPAAPSKLTTFVTVDGQSGYLRSSTTFTGSLSPSIGMKFAPSETMLRSPAPGAVEIHRMTLIADDGLQTQRIDDYALECVQPRGMS